ncbi:MAG: hypothetical protein AB1704_04485 [Pseudomonadota bacterium]|uniref:hypothetical protein n=1 Tax=Burkholderiaceae TaxID=119060 RepID=UPI0010F498FD|nr:hypothetical protein [Burkholderia sp. 4M9327F10]
MEQLSFGTCVKNSWISTWQAIARMPGLFLGAFAILACTSVLTGPFQHLPSQDADLDVAAKIGHTFLTGAFSVLQLVVYGCVTIKVNRFVLLGEGIHPLLPLGGKPLGRYALISVGLVVSMIALMLVLVLGMHGAGAGTGGAALIAMLAFFAYMFVIIRLSLLYPALSLGSRLTLSAAWKDSRGHFWSMVGIGVVAYLPLMIVWIAALEVFGRRALIAGTHGSPAFAIGLAFVNALFMVLAASVLSWLYRRYANELLRHVTS